MASNWHFRRAKGVSIIGSQAGRATVIRSRSSIRATHDEDSCHSQCSRFRAWSAECSSYARWWSERSSITYVYTNHKAKLALCDTLLKFGLSGRTAEQTASGIFITYHREIANLAALTRVP